MEETFNNIAKNLVGKLVKSKTDPLKAVLFDQIEERLLGMIVKVDRGKTLNREESVWTFHVLVDETVDILSYKDLSSFIAEWEVINQ